MLLGALVLSGEARSGLADGQPRRQESPVTFYACYGEAGGFCGTMANGETVHEGAAACGSAWPLGTVLRIEGDPLGPVTCKDRGLLAPTQVDRFFWREADGWAWLQTVGTAALVWTEPLSTPIMQPRALPSTGGQPPPDGPLRAVDWRLACLFP